MTTMMAPFAGIVEARHNRIGKRVVELFALGLRADVLRLHRVVENDEIGPKAGDLALNGHDAHHPGLGRLEMRNGILVVRMVVAGNRARYQSIVMILRMARACCCARSSL